MALKKHEYLLLILSLILTLTLVYGPHFNYKYPLHVDKLQHISKAI